MKKITSLVLSLILACMALGGNSVISANSEGQISTAAWEWSFDVMNNNDCFFWAILRIEPTYETQEKILKMIVFPENYTEGQKQTYDFFADGEINFKDISAVRRMRTVTTFNLDGQLYDYQICDKYLIEESDLNFMQYAVTLIGKQRAWAIARYDYNRNGEIDSADYYLAKYYYDAMEIIDQCSSGLTSRITFEEIESDINFARNDMYALKMAFSNTPTKEFPDESIVYYKGKSFIYLRGEDGHDKIALIEDFHSRILSTQYFVEDLEEPLSGFYIQCTK